MIPSAGTLCTTLWNKHDDSVRIGGESDRRKAQPESTDDQQDNDDDGSSVSCSRTSPVSATSEASKPLNVTKEREREKHVYHRSRADDGETK